MFFVEFIHLSLSILTSNKYYKFLGKIHRNLKLSLIKIITNFGMNLKLNFNKFTKLKMLIRAISIELMPIIHSHPLSLALIDIIPKKNVAEMDETTDKN